MLTPTRRFLILRTSAETPAADRNRSVATRGVHGGRPCQRTARQTADHRQRLARRPTKRPCSGGDRRSVDRRVRPATPGRSRAQGREQPPPCRDRGLAAGGKWPQDRRSAGPPGRPARRDRASDRRLGARSRADGHRPLPHRARRARILHDARLLATELVTNSVRHGDLESGTTIVLRMDLTAKTLRLEVENAGTAGAVMSRSVGRREGYGRCGLEPSSC